MLTFLDSIFNFTDALLAPLPSNLIDAIRLETPQTHPVTDAWIELSFAPVAIALSGLERYSDAATDTNVAAIVLEETSDATEETQLDDAKTELEEAIASLTTETFYRAQQPLHPSWRGILENETSLFIESALPFDPTSGNRIDNSIEGAVAPATESQQPLFSLVQVSDAVAYFLNNGTGEIQCVYAGLSRDLCKIVQDRSQSLAISRFQIPQCRYELRPAKRLQGFKWELKIKGLSLSQIERLAKEDLSIAPKVQFSEPKMTTPRAKLWRVKCDIHEAFSSADELIAASKFVELCDGRYKHVALLDPDYRMVDEWPRVPASPIYKQPESVFDFAETPDFDKLCPSWSVYRDRRYLGRILEKLTSRGFVHSKQFGNDPKSYPTREAAAEALLAAIEAEEAAVQRRRRAVLGDDFVDAFGGFAG